MQKVQDSIAAQTIGVEPRRVYRPEMVVQNVLHRYVIDCGCCGRAVVRWAWFGRVRCYFCRALNRVVFNGYY